MSQFQCILIFDLVCSTISFFVVFKGENLSNFTQTFRPSFSEQNLCSCFHKLWVLDEPKKDYKIICVLTSIQYQLSVT